VSRSVLALVLAALILLSSLAMAGIFALLIYRFL
jgi:hypothetical protein